MTVSDFPCCQASTNASIISLIYLHTVCAQLMETWPAVHKALGPKNTVGYCGKISGQLSEKHMLELLKRLNSTVFLNTHNINLDARETL